MSSAQDISFARENGASGYIVKANLALDELVDKINLVFKRMENPDSSDPIYAKLWM
jgi:hypothetical protein